MVFAPQVFLRSTPIFKLLRSLFEKSLIPHKFLKLFSYPQTRANSVIDLTAVYWLSSIFWRIWNTSTILQTQA
ncbi:MAG TPA: hypothetical protein V6D09_16220 [Leptolyngbyaceae cyanobacterium]